MIPFDRQKILLVCKGNIDGFPPLVTLARVLADVATGVTLITGECSEATKDVLEDAGICVVSLGAGAGRIRQARAMRAKQWLDFRRAAWSHIEAAAQSALLWLGTADTALALGRRLRRRAYVLQILELYDRFPAYRRLLEGYARAANCVVVPERSRAGIFQVWYRLAEPPFVIPNKPLRAELVLAGLELDRETQGMLTALSGRKLLLYQAANVRMDLTPLAEAMREDLRDEYVLGVLGNIRDTDMFTRARQIAPELVHFGYHTAPRHLLVTRHAHIGLLIYNYESLNNLFCAPNKLWEYSALAVPMVCNQLPALEAQLERYHAGVAFALGSPDGFAKAVRAVTAGHANYAEGARRLYDSVDLHAGVAEVLEAAGRGTRSLSVEVTTPC